MKILKSILFSIFMLTLITVFLTSCEKDVVTNGPVNQTEIPVKILDDKESQESSERIYILPHGYDDLSEDETKAYIASLDNTTMDQLVESRKIAKYFSHLNKLDELDSNSKTGDIFNEATLNKYLDKNEVENYKTFEVPTVQERCSCGGWSYSYSSYRKYCKRSHGLIVGCDCVHFDVYTRDCGDSWTCWFYREQKEEHTSTVRC